MSTASTSACAARSGERSACPAPRSASWLAHSGSIPTKARAQRGRLLLMAKIKLGISLRSLPWPLRRSLQEAQRAGAQGVELAAQGDLAPQGLSQTGPRAVRHPLGSYDLVLGALFCPLRHGLDVAENLQPRIDFIMEAMTLAFDLGPRLVVVQACKLSDKDDDPR